MQLVISWFVGCTSGIHDVTFVPGTIPGTGQVTFSSRADGEAVVRHGFAGEPLDVESPGAPAEGGVVPLLGLPTTKKLEMQVVVGDHESDVIEVTIPPPPQGVPTPLLNSWDPEQSCGDGYILFSYIGDTGSGVAILDRQGNYVWVVPEEDLSLQVGRARPGRDGKSILWNIADAEHCVDVATITRQPMDGSAKTVTRTLNGHHDFVELPDGKMAWLGYSFHDDVDPPEGADLGKVRMAADTIYESEEGAETTGSEDTIFEIWDDHDYPPGVYTLPPDSVRAGPDGPEPAFLCDAYEFGHGNSLVYRESDDSYFMMWRWLDTLIKVDRTADIPYVWEMGGAYGNLPGTPEPPFQHAHVSDVWDGGMLIFDNGPDLDVSRLVEFTFDDAGYQQVSANPGSEHESILGDVRRIPVEGCDNLLVSWSRQGRISEITREGEIVWDVSTSGTNNITSRVYYLPNLYDFSAAAYP